MKNLKFILVALVAGLALSSCQKEESFNRNDIYGLWLEDNTQHYVRFTTEQSDEAGYMYGREWDLAEKVTEEKLQPYGNGWFKYLFETNGNLTEIHLMDNGGAEIPKVYVVSVLTADKLEYYEKDYKNIRFKYTRAE